MFHFARQLRSKPADAVRHSRVTLQQALMALRRGTFEDIQSEAPFRPHAQTNLLHLLTAYVMAGDAGIAKAWREIFPDDREVPPVKHQPIRIMGGDGESSNQALEVLGAPDQETRVAAEWWHLRYRFGRGFTPGMHMTTMPNASGESFSVHDIELAGGLSKKVYFRLPDSGKETALKSNQVPHTGDRIQEPQPNIQRVGDYVAKISKLPEVGRVWLLGWNIAAGQWRRIGLDPQAGKEYLADLFGRLQGDLSDLSKRSAEQLQHGLMALRRGSFEEIQDEAPFSRFAQRNMESLLRAWEGGGQREFSRVWDSTFHRNWEEEREEEYPIQVIGGPGDCEQRAFELLGAPDQHRRVEAEFWCLFYTFGNEWKWKKHETVGDEHGGPHLSVHHIQPTAGSDRQVYFRTSW